MGRRHSQYPKYPKVENLVWAALAKFPPSFIERNRKRGKRGKGLKFEAEVQKALTRAAGGLYLPSPWIMYATQGRGTVQWCQPDGLLFNPQRGIIYIIECKLKHTADAWWQLHEQYTPVVQHIFPRDLWELRCTEIVNWYDATTFFPGRHYLRRRVSETQAQETGVIIWNRPSGKQKKSRT